MKIFENEGSEWAAIFGIFLNPKGKVLFDSIIVKPKLNKLSTHKSQDVEYWIDIDENDC